MSLSKPRQMGPPITLLRLHLKETGVSSTHDGECSQSTTKINYEPTQPKVYAAIHKHGKSFRPDDVLVVLLPEDTVLGRNPNADDFQAFYLGMTVGLSQLLSRSKVKFCVLRGASVPNIVGAGCGLINLKLGPAAAAPLMDFVSEIKVQNISDFLDSVHVYLGRHASADKQYEYLKIMNSKTSDEVDKFESLQIWHMLTLEQKIMKALEANDLIQTPIRFPIPSLLPTPPPGWTADHANHSASELRPCYSTKSVQSENFIQAGDRSGHVKRKRSPETLEGLATNKLEKEGKELVTSQSAS